MDAPSSDPLLTTLCSVCRAQPPRYKCPQCVTRYCSVPCNRRHRARTGCSGIRDVTTFVPKSKLCTESGIDRDYNFLQRIETARFSTHKHVVDERGVLRQNEVKARVLGEDDQSKTVQRGKYNNKNGQNGQNRKPQEPAALQKQWQGEELRYVPTRPRVPRLADGDGSDAAAVCALAEPAAPAPYEAAASQRVRALCRRDGITLLGAPRGLARQRANNTTVWTERAAAATTSGAGKQASEMLLHWQVEWVLHHNKASMDGTSKPAPVLKQLLDNVPLFRAYVSLINWRQKQASNITSKPSKPVLIAEEVDAGDAEDMDTREDSEEARGAKASRRPSPAEGSADKNSFFYNFDVQSQDTAAWKTTIADSDAGLSEALLAAKYDLRYFLLKPRAPGAPPPSSAAGKGPVNELIPLESTDTLATALPGRSVLEFPTIYVLPAGVDELPAGCVLGSTARKAIVKESSSNTNNKPGAKRPWDGGRNSSSAARKRVQFAEQEADESETSSSGSDSSDEEEEEEGSDEEEEEDGELLDTAPAVVGLKGLPPLPLSGLAGITEARADGGKGKLVVYDSWSEGEGSGEE